SGEWAPSWPGSSDRSRSSSRRTDTARGANAPVWRNLPRVGEEDRRRWAVPSGQGRMGDIAVSLLDPGDEGDRHFLILAEHPDLQQAIEDDQDEITLNGNLVSPRLHISIHEIVANQVWMDNPPETWQTAKRLMDVGYER